MSEEFSKDELILFTKIIKDLPATEYKLKNLLGDLYPKVITKPFIVKFKAKSKKSSMKFNFTSEFKKELKNFIQSEELNSSKNRNTNEENLEKLILSIVKQQLEPIYRRLEKLENLNNSNKYLSNSDFMNEEEFRKKLKERYDKINLNEQKGGMVPIPSLKNEFKEENLTEDHFKKYLFNLERKRVIDLQIASDRKGIPNPELGIDDKVRGLIYYVVWRT